MDDIVNRLARELADAIAASVADDPQVEACREKARAAGFEMKVTLEAVVGFVNRTTTDGKGRRDGQGADAGESRRVEEGTRHDRQRPPIPALPADCFGRAA